MPRIWPEMTVFILGGGPSLNDADFSLIQHRRIIGVNNSYGDPVHNKKGKLIGYKPRPWVDICWFGDGRWYSWHIKDLREFSGLIAHCVPRLKNAVGLHSYTRGKPAGIETRQGFVAWNRNSGASAINLAYHLGASRVILLGFDMRRIDDRANWHDDHPSPQKNPYHRFLRLFPKIAKDAGDLGLEIINCTPDSAIDQFPIMTLEAYLKKEVDDKDCQS